MYYPHCKKIQEISKENQIFCARYGGDEFILIYERYTRQQVNDYASQLKSEVMKLGIEHKFSKEMPIVTISQGICFDIPEEGGKIWDFLHTADAMLYKVKESRRNNYCIGTFSEEGNMVNSSTD